MKTFKQHLDERCWPGHKPVPGKKPYSPGSCRKEEVEQIDEAIPKSTHYATLHSSSRKIVAKGNKKEMLKKIKELNNKEKGSHHLGMTYRGKVGDTFGEEVEQYEADDGPLTEEQLEQLREVAAWQRKEGKSEAGGLNRKGIESYRRENPGSKLSMAVTTKPSKLKPGSKAANRRKSFCARMGGMKRRLTSAKTARDPDSRINKALRKWNC